MRMILFALSLFLAAIPAQAADVQRYADLIQAAMAELEKGPAADLDAITAQQEEMLKIGIEACLDFAAESEEFRPTMTFVIDSIPAMRAMSLDEIERQWHEGEALVASGYWNSTIEHFGVINSLMDMVLHPVTVMIALDAYRQMPDPKYLEQSRDELDEVSEHIQHI